MAKVLFPEDISHFIASLGEYQIDILTDLRALELAGPQALDSPTDHGNSVWSFCRLIAPSRYAYLLFAHHRQSDSYIVLHGFRAGPEGVTKTDLREARRRWEEYR